MMMRKAMKQAVGRWQKDGTGFKFEEKVYVGKLGGNEGDDEGEEGDAQPEEKGKRKKVLKKSETTDSVVSTFLPPGVTLDTVRNSKTQIYELDEMIKRNKEQKKSIKESVPPGVVVGSPYITPIFVRI